MPDAPFTPEEERALAENVELDMDLRRKVLTMHRNLDRLDFYALLGVDRTTDRKGIKRAYYDLAARFHPDRHFRKNLGSFKLRTEMIFARLTLAHDALAHEQKRAEYDAYLKEKRKARTIEELMSDAVAEVQRAKDAIEREVRGELSTIAPAPAPIRRMTPPAGPQGIAGPPGMPRSATPVGVPVRPGPPATPRPTPAPAGGHISVNLAARRDALAQRLLGGARASVPPPGAETGRPAPMSTAEAMEALKRRYMDRVKQIKAAEARKYVAKAEAALKSGDAFQAAASLRIALDLAPDNPDLQKKAGETQAKADELLCDTYARQAEYEEKNGQWAEAVASWKRVCHVRPQDAHAHERAAHSILRAGEDLREAATFAKTACELAPDDAAAHVTRGSVFLATGDTTPARAALDIAAQLAPQDGTIQAMLRRLSKLE